jgi:hypothetical protein
MAIEFCKCINIPLQRPVVRLDASSMAGAHSNYTCQASHSDCATHSRAGRKLGGFRPTWRWKRSLRRPLQMRACHAVPAVSRLPHDRASNPQDGFIKDKLLEAFIKQSSTRLDDRHQRVSQMTVPRNTGFPNGCRTEMPRHPRTCLLASHVLVS